MENSLKNNPQEKSDRQTDLSGLKQKVGNIHRRWADSLGKCTANFKRKHWIIALILFVLTAGGYSSYLMLESFLSKGRMLFSVYPIYKPLFFMETGEENINNNAQIPSKEYGRVLQYKRFMDSLAISPSGKKLYDSILFHHPGLMDSLLYIERNHRLPSE